MCATWEPGGANACLVLEPEALQEAETPPPDPAPPRFGALNIVGWREGEDGVTAQQAAHFDETGEPLPEALHDGVAGETRLGGMPAWIQGRVPLAVNGWRFVGQIDSIQWLSSEEEARRLGGVRYDGPNFADSGMAYLMIEDGDPPRIFLTWQCC